MKNALIFVFVLIAALTSCAPFEAPPARVETSDLRVLVVVTSSSKLLDGSSGGYYLPEVVDFYEVVNDAGIAIDIASPLGGKAPMYARGANMGGRKMSAILHDRGLLADLDDTVPLERIRPSDYDAVYYVGGFAAMMDFSTDPRVAAIGAEIYESGGSIAAVCHGPTALVNMKLYNGEYLVKGKKLTSRTVQEDGMNRYGALPFLLERALRDRGAQFSKGPNGAAHVEEDGRLITGQGPSATTEVAERLVRQLASKQPASYASLQ